MRWFGGCDRLHVSGYTLLRRPIDEAAREGRGRPCRLRAAA